MDDYSYGQAYAAWQAELRESAAAASAAHRDGRHRPTRSAGRGLSRRVASLWRALDPRPASARRRSGPLGQAHQHGAGW
jgi:hypothetical protein